MPLSGISMIKPSSLLVNFRQVDVPRDTGVVTLDSVERQRADVDLFPSRRPGNGGVVGRVTWLADDDDEIPLQRLAVNLCDQRFEQEVLVLGRSGLPWLRGRQDPAHRCGLAGRVDETKRIQAVEHAVAEP